MRIRQTSTRNRHLSGGPVLFHFNLAFGESVPTLMRLLVIGQPLIRGPLAQHLHLPFSYTLNIDIRIKSLLNQQTS